VYKNDSGDLKPDIDECYESNDIFGEIEEFQLASSKYCYDPRYIILGISICSNDLRAEEHLSTVNLSKIKKAKIKYKEEIGKEPKVWLCMRYN